MPSLLVGAYLVSFVTDAAGTSTASTAVSGGLLAGILATALLFFGDSRTEPPEQTKRVR